MQILHKLVTSNNIKYIAKYRKVVGVFLLVIGLVFTVSGGVGHAFFEKPVYQQAVLAATILPTPTPEKEVPKVVQQEVSQDTFGPPLPATPTSSLTPSPTVTLAPSTNSITSGATVINPTITNSPTATATPTPTLTTTSTPEKQTTTAAIIMTTMVMVTVTPTPTITPTPSIDKAATDGAIWDKLATCESNNHWNDDTGNGYYGGLQFGQGTWESVGGTGNPAHASREEQIMRGKMLQARRGWGPWGGCGHALGLL